jgi:hypothetical protein
MIKIKRFRHEEWLIVVRNQRIGVIRKVGKQFGWRDRFGGHWFATHQEAIEALVRLSRQIQLRRAIIQEQAEAFGAKNDRSDRDLVEPMH